MGFFDLISYLKNLGIELSFNSGKIQARPNYALTDSIRNQIITHRAELITYLQIDSACNDLLVHPLQVMNRLLSIDDEQDLIHGSISEIELKLHIKLWIAKGMPNYCGKPESTDERRNDYA